MMSIAELEINDRRFEFNNSLQLEVGGHGVTRNHNLKLDFVKLVGEVQTISLGFRVY